MIKIAITGHTSGLGKALFEHYSNSIGLSRSTGFDITQPQNIIENVGDCDVFINNAYDGIHQVTLLYELIDYGFSGKIINISSNSGDGIKSKAHVYAIDKNALDKANEQLYYMGHDVTSVRPGWIDTPRVAFIEEEKLNPDKVINIIDFIINCKHRVKEITFSI